MRRISLLLILATWIGPGSSSAVPVEPPGEPVIVVLEPGADPSAVAREHDRTHGAWVSHTYRSALNGYAARVSPEGLAGIRNDPRVAFVSPDREFRASGLATALAWVRSFQILPTGVDRIDAEEKANQGDGVQVAVLDTGIDLDHPDLQPNTAGGVNCSSGTTFDDGNGHGTHVAGTIAALHNTIGVVGVAPEAKLWAVRVLNNAGRGSTSSILCGVDFVDASSPARGGSIAVANMSLGGSGRDDGNCGLTNLDPIHMAVCATVADGVTFAVAAGNEEKDVQRSIPAAYDEVITVTALVDIDGRPCGLGPGTNVGADDTFASFSNFATVDIGHTIAAPGVKIISTFAGGGYETLSGTSMATPHVAGAAALYLAIHPGTSPADLFAALKSLGEPAGTSFGGECAVGSSHTDPGGRHPEVVVRAGTL